VESNVFSVDEFRLKINQLLALTWDSELVEKVTEALHENMFPDDYSELIRQLESATFDDEDGDASEGNMSSSYTPLTSADHRALMSMQAFLHNLHNFANQVYLPLFRQHLLIESRLTQDLILPYLHSCCREAQQFSMQHKSGDSRGSDMLTEEKLVMQGISSSLKTIVIATFRCSRYSHAVEIFWTLNPTYLLLEKCTNFIQRHEAVLALLVFFNVNLGTLDTGTTEGVPELLEENKPAGILLAIGKVFARMDEKQQKRVMALVEGAGQLPLSRDVKSYLVALHLLNTLYNGEDSGAAMKCDEALVERVLSEIDNGGADWYPDDTQIDDDDEGKDDGEESKGGESESKSSAEDDEKKEKYRLLGDLPTLGGGGKDALTLPPKRKKKKKSRRSKNEANLASPMAPESPGGAHAPLPGNVPTDYVCAINGHVMKEPVRASSGKVYEKTTLELWVNRNGSVCPITGEPLTGEIEIDKELQTAIMRWHITQAMDANKDPFGSGGGGMDDDDMYAF
jgi:hypothetical protein